MPAPKAKEAEKRVTNERKCPRGAIVIAVVVVLGVCAYAGGQAKSGLASGARNKASARLGAKASPRRGQVRTAETTDVTLKKIKSSAATGRAAARGPSANSGQVIQLSGNGFGSEVSVEFLGFAGSTFSLRPTKVKMSKITISVPVETVTGDVRLRDPAAGASNGVKLQVVPAISTFTPAEIAPGGRLLIDGSGYSRDTKVYFQGVKTPVAPTIVSPTRVDILVPEGARSGKVSVVTTGGRSAAKKLKIVGTGAAERASRPRVTARSKRT
jgi:hypothetical protein